MKTNQYDISTLRVLLKLHCEQNSFSLKITSNVQYLIIATNVPDSCIILVIFNQISCIKYLSLFMSFYRILSKKLSVTLVKFDKCCSMLLNSFQETFILNIQAFFIIIIYTSNILYNNEWYFSLNYIVHDLVYVCIFFIINIYIMKSLTSYECFLFTNFTVCGPIYGCININFLNYKTIMFLFELFWYVFSHGICKFSEVSKISLQKW